MATAAKKHTDIDAALASLTKPGAAAKPERACTRVDAYLEAERAYQAAHAEREALKREMREIAEREFTSLRERGDYCRQVELKGATGSCTVTRKDTYGKLDTSALDTIREIVGAEVAEALFAERVDLRPRTNWEQVVAELEAAGVEVGKHFKEKRYCSVDSARGWEQRAGELAAGLSDHQRYALDELAARLRVAESVGVAK